MPAALKRSISKIKSSPDTIHFTPTLPDGKSSVCFSCSYLSCMHIGDLFSIREWKPFFVMFSKFDSQRLTMQMSFERSQRICYINQVGITHSTVCSASEIPLLSISHLDVDSLDKKASSFI